jgi:hypothetical protein
LAAVDMVEVGAAGAAGEAPGAREVAAAVAAAGIEL